MSAGVREMSELECRYPYNLTRVVRASEVDTDDTWIYEDGHDEVVFSVDRNCQLLGSRIVLFFDVTFEHRSRIMRNDRWFHHRVRGLGSQ